LKLLHGDLDYLSGAVQRQIEKFAMKRAATDVETVPRLSGERREQAQQAPSRCPRKSISCYYPEHDAAEIVFAQKAQPREAQREESADACARFAAMPRELVIITGMSGSGKASVLKAFEDLGYYCVDNLPVELIPRFAEMALQSAEIRRTALVVDVREGSKLEQLPGILKAVRRMIPTKVAFLEASDAVLMRRFSETRRPHPLGTDTPVNASIKAERRHLAAIRAVADFVIDTSKFNVHELRAHITERFREQPPREKHTGVVREFRLPPRRTRRGRSGVRRSFSAKPALRARVPALHRPPCRAWPNTFARFRRRRNLLGASRIFWCICCRITSTKARAISRSASVARAASTVR
jgi:chloramphenicol 3-O-phosphotransferase